MPPPNVWIEIDEGLHLTHFSELEKMSEHSVRDKMTVKLKCCGQDGGERADAFLQKAFEWYTELVSKQENNTRYMYSPVITKEDKTISFKRYALTEDKTFDSMFFQEKSDIINMVDLFEKKQGRYAVKGSPHKLGFLLHGPPGTGKTTFIKALAVYTGRNIINVPLSRLKTNEQLMEVIFNHSLTLVGENDKASMHFKDCIFVFEDIDAASDVVIDREQKKKKKDIEQLSSADERMLKNFEDQDKLNLAGLLGCLDGVIDTPGRIVIATSNHPEMLDPALIRPGRIDKILHMGYITPSDTTAMLEHFFSCKLTDEQQLELQSAFERATVSYKTVKPNDVVVSDGTCRFTAAMIEQMCAEYSTPDKVIAALIVKRNTVPDWNMVKT